MKRHSPGLRLRLEGLGAVCLLLAALGCTGEAVGRDWVSVQRGELVLGVAITGELEAVDSDSLGPPLVSGISELKIARMAPEGETIQKGQPALAFDTSELTRKLEAKQNERAAVAAEIGKKRADAAILRRNEELSIAEVEGKLRKAELKAERSGELTGSLELALAKADFELAQKELAYQKARAKAVQRYDQRDLEALRFRESEADARVKEIEAALPQMTVPAPRTGTVIYISSWNNQKKKVGDAAWRGERVLTTASLERMSGRGEIDEVDVSKIALDQPVSLRLEAYPDVEYTGSIRGIGRLVEQQSRDNPRRIVRTTFDIVQADPARMRPGMRFRGTAQTERITGALLIPLSAVFPTEQGPVAYKRSGIGPEAVALTLGKSNDQFAEVLSGLREGDEVSRLVPGSEPAAEEERKP